MIVRYYRALSECRHLRKAYRTLLEAYDKATSEPCPMCEEMERERNNALLELDIMRADLDDAHAGRVLAEQLCFDRTQDAQ